MYSKIAALTAVGMMLASQAAAADASLAKVSGVSGSVVASQAGKLSPVANAAQLKAGDRIVARDGQASISYADGCVVTLKPGSMTTIGAASPCVDKGGLVTAANGSSAQLFQSDFGIALASWGVMLVIAAVLANDDDNDPVRNLSIPVSR